jgi:serine protease AprX
MVRASGAFLLVLSVLVTPAAGAAPSTDAPGPVPGLADVDGDRVSDALESHLDGLDPSTLIDVVVTWSGPPDIAAANAAAGPFSVTERFTIIDGFSATVRAGQVRGLARAPGVFRVEQDFEVQLTVDDADATIGTDAGRNEFGVDGSGIVACVLDTGADAGHEQLDQNKIIAWQDFTGNALAPVDGHGHGTHVASTLAGDGDGNSPDAARLGGIAPGASLAIGKVLDDNGSGPESGIISGIQWCVLEGADLISMSLGTNVASDGSDALSQAVDSTVLNWKIPVIVAAGNSGDADYTVGSPGAAREALTVGASGDNDSGLRLAYFSSRGPTLDGRTKPDVVAPGMGIYAAEAGTTSGYVAFSGTSMATPVTAGTVALALDVDSSLTPAQIKTAIHGTAFDLGRPGFDNDWGAGFLDGHGLLASVAGSQGGTALPVHQHVAGTVADGGLWTHSFSVDELDGPIAITLLIDGEGACVWELLPGWCFAYEWSPDLDARLVAPGGNEIALSTCPAGTECGAMGRQEVLVADPTVAGTYRLEVWPYSGSPNNGTGGPFVADIFFGASGSLDPPPGEDPPPENLAPDAVDDAYGTPEDSVLVVGAPGVLANDTDPESDPLGVSSYTQPASGSVSVSGDGGFQYTPNPDFFGVDLFTYTADDGNGGSDTATVNLTVDPVNDAPVADAGTDTTVTDTDGSGSEAVTLDGSDSSDIDGTIVGYEWSDGATVLGSGVSPTFDFTEGTHTVTLLVTDDLGSTDTDTVVVTVEPPPPPPPADAVHIADLDTETQHAGNGWKARVWAEVHDGGHMVVNGATVRFALSTGDELSCQTNRKGRCAVNTGKISNSLVSVEFTVVAVEYSGFTYAPVDNHDPDGDSDGTTVFVTWL